MTPLIQIIKEQSSPLAPIETEEQSSLPKLEGIRCVLFDIYGTLMVSGVGDISHSKAENRSQSIARLADELNFSLKNTTKDLGEAFLEIIKSHQAQTKATGVIYPEVEIREVWLDYMQNYTYQDVVNVPTHPLIEEAAVRFELMVNPTWPMPFLEMTLCALKNNDIELGIVSNAQFFTPLLFNAYFDRSVESFGFAEDLCQWSFFFKEAKPSTRLYRLNSMKLEAKYGIQPNEVLYVGNDMLNDIMPAQEVGFKTALFAGDQRSLRWRENDPRVNGIKPDMILTSLDQIPGCIID
ncbi:MAG: HAD hydrolase-like protein [Opitutales bacterium]|nr:HAD hydrolase-like protein [Opitutales bacterium]